MTRDQYIATEIDRDERTATPDNDPEEARLQAEDEAQQQPRLTHCGHTMHVDRSNPERQHCSVVGCNYEVRVRPFGYAPGWTVHEVETWIEIVEGEGVGWQGSLTAFLIDNNFSDEYAAEILTGIATAGEFGDVEMWGTWGIKRLSSHVIEGRYRVVREAGHVDRERADALNRRVVR